MKNKAAKLILMRHGQSAWNQKNIFTGWVDIPLSPQGIQEAVSGGKKIAAVPIDEIYTSTLIRAQMTVVFALQEHASQKLPVFIHSKGRQSQWEEMYGKEAKEETIPAYIAEELNERMYGKLQGLNKKATAETFGQEQVQIWRRSFHIAPPDGESLQMTVERAVPFFQEQIEPKIMEGKNILIVAHGNSLRGIVMYLKHLSAEEVVSLEIPTGIPLFFERHEGHWRETTE